MALLGRNLRAHKNISKDRMQPLVEARKKNVKKHLSVLKAFNLLLLLLSSESIVNNLSYDVTSF